MNFFRIFLILLLTLSFVNCASNPVAFDEGKPIEIKGTFWTRNFKQNGKVLRYDTVLEALKQYDASNPKAKVAEAWGYSAVASSAIGGGLVGYYLFDTVDSSNTRGTGFLVGAVLIGVGLLFGYWGDEALVEGTQIYNDELKYKAPQGRLQPVFDITSLGYGNALVPYLGLKFSGF